MSSFRITGGSLRGRRFGGKVGDATRPTAERVREALGSVLHSRGRFEDARVLDLYSGTGALAFEALSRGARAAVLIDSDPQAERQLRSSAEALGLTRAARAIRLDLSKPQDLVAALRAEAPFDLVFADPPYVDIERVTPLLEALIEASLFAEDALAIVEYDRRRPPPLTPKVAMVADYRYGDTAVALLARPESMG